MNLEQELSTLIELSFQEDGDRDLTSELLFDETEEKDASLVAKQMGVICGLKFAEKICQHADLSLVVEPYLEDGDQVQERMVILGLHGKTRSLLRIERVLINFLSRLSGIATFTRKFVDAVEGTGTVILDTRKTIPGWRFLDKYAVTMGGGINHRMNLSDIAMIKDSHLEAMVVNDAHCSGAVTEAIRRFREKEMTKPLIVEVRSLAEFKEALPAAKSLTRITLDNFSIAEITEAVVLSNGKVLLEASGNITLENARSIAETGVHFLSIGALTHSAPGFDLSMKIAE